MMINSVQFERCSGSLSTLLEYTQFPDVWSGSDVTRNVLIRHFWRLLPG